MNKTILILRNEIITNWGRKSFLFTTFGIPLIAALIFFGVSVLKGGDSASPGGPGGAEGSGSASGRSELKVQGYVDQSGLITAIPSEIPEGILVAYSDQVSAREALAAGEISAYYVIPADYVASGDLIYIDPDYLPLSSGSQTWVMRQTIFANLLGNDPERIARAGQPMDVQVEALAPSRIRGEADSDNDTLTFYVPYATGIIIYFVVLMSSTLLLNSVSDEKKNRVIEILLVSISPRQMLSGKIVGLGVLGLLQALVWVGTGYGLLRLGGQTLDLPADFKLPLSVLLWGMLFFLFGYATYASLLAGLGALAPSLKEASQSTILVIWPLLVPLVFIVLLIEQPHSTLATGLSLFPLTAPVAMMTRMVAGDVPAWQPLLALGFLIATVWGTVRVVARMFRAQTLLSGQPVTIKRLLAALLGRF